MLGTCAEFGIPKSVDMDRDLILNIVAATPRSGVHLDPGLGGRKWIEILPDDQNRFDQGWPVVSTQPQGIRRVSDFPGRIEKRLGLQVSPSVQRSAALRKDQICRDLTRKGLRDL